MATHYRVTKPSLDAAVMDVQDELYHHGLWIHGSRLVKTDVYWCPLPQLPIAALGFFTCGRGYFDRILGYEPSHIYIPQWVLTHGWWRSRGSLRDVVRHEYGHALAWHYPELFGRKFTRAFGAGHDDDVEAVEPCISDYAQTNPSEDFAETFMFFLRHKGRLPSRHTCPAIRRKWAFVQQVCKAVLGRHR